MRSPVNAGLVAAGAMLLGLVLPPLGWLSGAVIGLVALRLGAAATLRVAVPALAGLGLAGALALGQGQGVAIALSGLGFWLPVMVLALVLRQRVRLNDTLLVACAMGWLLVAAIWLALGDPAPYWQERLLQVFPPSEWGQRLQVSADAVRTMWTTLAPLMTGLLATATVLGALLSLLLARWLQAALYNPGGFGREFRSLRLGRTAAVVVLGLGGLALVTGSPLIDSLALVAAAVYAFQGLAVAHGVVHAAGLGPGWLVALYIALVLPPVLPYAATGLLVLGGADAWADYRRRVPPGGTG